MSPENQHQPINRERRVRRLAGLLVGGVIVATGTLALPALALTTDDAAPGPATTTTGSSLAEPTAAPATTIPESTTTTAPPKSPEEILAEQFAAMTDEDKVAFEAYVNPPPPPPTTTTTKPAPAKAAATGGVAPNAFLACVRQRESGGNYAINTGNGYYGAYQFSQSTWNNTAANAGRSDLVGVRPSSVSPAEQDAMAAHLYAWYGRSPWAGPGC